MYCGIPDRRKALLTTAQVAGEYYQHAELAITQVKKKKTQKRMAVSCPAQQGAHAEGPDTAVQGAMKGSIKALLRACACYA